MKRVYVCAPLGGNIEENLKKVKTYTAYALRCGTAPVVPHFYALCLDDMRAELKFCKNLNIRIRYITEKEIQNVIGGKTL